MYSYDVKDCIIDATITQLPVGSIARSDAGTMFESSKIQCYTVLLTSQKQKCKTEHDVTPVKKKNNFEVDRFKGGRFLPKILRLRSLTRLPTDCSPERRQDDSRKATQEDDLRRLTLVMGVSWVGWAPEAL